MVTENLSTLKIHKLTQEQYERERDAGRLDESALYLTPQSDIDLSDYATKEFVADRIADAEFSGGNGNYELSVATADTLGGVRPVAKTGAMTQPVGVDTAGRLYTVPCSGGGDGSGSSVTGSDNYIRVSSLAECTDPTKQYVLPNGYIYYCPSGVLTKEITIEEKTGGFWQITNGVPTWTPTNGYTGQRTNQLSVSEGETFKYVGRSEWQIPAVIWYDSSRAQMDYVVLSPNAAKNRTSANFVVPSGAAYAQFYTYMGSSGETALTVEYVPFVSTGQMVSSGGTTVASGGVLYGKKYVACGDSFTEGDFTNASEDERAEAYDDELGMYKTYPWQIAQRNGMILVNEAKCGSTMYNNGKANAFSVSRYKEIPTDADYITLCFGLNEESNLSDILGTSADTTNATVWGAWNVVLEYLITNLPYAKIGIIIPDAWTSSTMRNALIEIARYWGIPYLDLKGDDTVPLLISSKIGYTVNSKAVELRRQAFCVDPASGDTHPNLKGHAYRSTIIENFMRSL